MIASSSSSPPTRIDCETTIPPSEMTATSVGPPPLSTLMLPVRSLTGSPSPRARAGADRLRGDDPAQRDDGHLGGAATDVDDHVAGRLADRKPGADRDH